MVVTGLPSKDALSSMLPLTFKTVMIVFTGLTIIEEGISIVNDFNAGFGKRFKSKSG